MESLWGEGAGEKGQETETACHGKEPKTLYPKRKGDAAPGKVFKCPRSRLLEENKSLRNANRELIDQGRGIQRNTRTGSVFKRGRLDETSK